MRASIPCVVTFHDVLPATFVAKLSLNSLIACPTNHFTKKRDFFYCQSEFYPMRLLILTFIPLNIKLHLVTKH